MDNSVLGERGWGASSEGIFEVGGGFASASVNDPVSLLPTPLPRCFPFLGSFQPASENSVFTPFVYQIPSSTTCINYISCSFSVSHHTSLTLSQNSGISSSSAFIDLGNPNSGPSWISPGTLCATNKKTRVNQPHDSFFMRPSLTKELAHLAQRHLQPLLFHSLCKCYILVQQGLGRSRQNVHARSLGVRFHWGQMSKRWGTIGGWQAWGKVGVGEVRWVVAGVGAD